MCTTDWNTIGTWITAITTTALAVLTFLTLLKLRTYADDTARMADSANAQLLASAEDRESYIRPVIAIGFTNQSKVYDANRLYLTNVGTGVAINIRWLRAKDGAEENRHVPFMDNRPHTGPVLASDLNDVVHYQNKILKVTYESLSGRLYESCVEIGELYDRLWQNA